MIRTTVVASLTLALGLFHVAPKEAGNLSAVDKLREEPVIVKVSVLNNDTGAFVANLRAEDFIIEENGVKQKPTRFLHEERPLSILLLLDSSGSMRPIIQGIIEGVSKALRRLTPDDEVALMTFKDSVTILQDFTTNKGLVEEKLRGVVASRPTLARQALLQAATHMLNATAADSRRVIVMITDNRPSTGTGDVLSEDVMQKLSASGSVVCGLIASGPPFVSGPLYPPAGGSLRVAKPTPDITSYVDETGGIVESVPNVKPEEQEISARLVKTIDAFRNYYWIEYFSTNSKRDGKHRKIKVTLSPDVKKSGRKLTVLAKRGYYAPTFAKSDEKK